MYQKRPFLWHFYNSFREHNVHAHHDEDECIIYNISKTKLFLKVHAHNTTKCYPQKNKRGDVEINQALQSNS